GKCSISDHCLWTAVTVVVPSGAVISSYPHDRTPFCRVAASFSSKVVCFPNRDSGNPALGLIGWTSIRGWCADSDAPGGNYVDCSGRGLFGLPCPGGVRQL